MPGLERFPREAARTVVSTLGFGILLAVLSYRAIDLAPEPGLDPSWKGGLHLAAHSSLNWGPDLNFTYGPLGFLSVPKLYYDDTGVLAVVWLQFTRALALGTVFVLSRRTLGTVPTFVLLVLLGAAVLAPEVLYAAAVSLVLVNRPQRHPYLRPLLVSVALLAAVTCLVKLSIGAAVGAVALVAAVTGPGSRQERRTDVLVLAAAFLGPVLALWFLSGQRLDAIPQYLLSSKDIVSGYSAAMGIEDPSARSDYVSAVIVLGVGIVAIRLGAETLDSAVLRRAGLVWFVAWFFQFKAGFVRHDPGHALLLFSVTPFLAMVAVARIRSRGTAFGLLLAPIAVLVSVGNLDLRTMWGPLDGVSSAFEQAGDLADNDFRIRQAEIGRRNIAQANQLPKEVFDDVSGKTVHVRPAETSIVWAYGLKWKPAPTFQSYAAYTDRLDEENAERLADPREGPGRVIVHQEPSIDGRFAAFDEPRVSLTLMCRFRPAVVSGPWLSLARTADRCGQPRRLRTVSFGWDQKVPVPVPPPGTAIIADVEGTGVHGFEAIRSFAYKARDRAVYLNDSIHRLIPGVGDGPFVLRADAGLDLPEGFGQIPQVQTIGFGKADAEVGSGDLRITFSVMAFRPRVTVTPPPAPVLSRSRREAGAGRPARAPRASKRAPRAGRR